MIELFEQDSRTIDRQSSKGNQLKWEKTGIWYKADYAGYEGLAEYMISQLLKKSSLRENEFVIYELEQISYHKKIWNGTRSCNFLPEGQQIITLQRLYKNKFNRSFNENVWKIDGIKNRFFFLAEQVERLTGMKAFDKYLSKLLTIDAFFLNEDRHLHNIAVLMDADQNFTYCPIFDQGAGLLSDTTLDYPLDEDVYDLIKTVHAKTISRDFDEQLDAAEAVSGDNLKFNFTKKDVKELLDGVTQYDDAIKKRVETIIYSQMSKYQYLFQ